MRFNLLSDANWESKISQVLSTLSDFEYRRFFEEKYYGSSLEGITVVFICRNPEHNFRQRIRHSKKEKKIYLDIMLDLDQFIQVTQTEREKIIAQRLIVEIAPVIAKYKFEDFNLARFKNDLEQWLQGVNWL
ncbi:hypothetical protein [Mucilaginibacter lacusdianchii]|uniref:hypothetical protein n=1 Tax=Mucilaginibacter lacusdianchii TaxID=2684211 RepID=UPI00131D683F|nr:hypothetical protein [Mucilaginibacter sp. JXJ CY 39]